MTIDFGRKINHDPRSREYEHEPREAMHGVNTYHYLGAPHVDQFYLSGCVGFSGTNLLNFSKAVNSRVAFNRAVKYDKAGRSYLGNNDGIENYHEATVFDDFEGTYPPDDTGSSALGLMKYWKSIGVIKSYEWIITGGFDKVLAALQRQPLLFGTYWYDDMMTTDEQGLIHTTLSGGKGGHEYVGSGIMWDHKLVRCENSWGEHPPNFQPTFFVPFDVLEALIADDGDVAVPVLL